jgi:hypothetical protein
VQVSNGVGGTSHRYTGADLLQLYQDCGYGSNSQNILNAKKWDPKMPPGVEAWIVYGTGHATPYTFEFASSQFTGKPDFSSAVAHCGDGDSVATTDSVAGVPARWAGVLVCVHSAVSVQLATR